MDVTYSVCHHCGKMNRAKLDSLITGHKPICGSCSKPLPLKGSIIEADNDHFWKLVEKSPIPIVIDFWAEWCGPCKNFAPIFERVADKLKGKYVFAKLDTELHPNISTNLGIKGIPTLMVFNKGKEVARQSGAMPEEMFIQWLSLLKIN